MERKTIKIHLKSEDDTILYSDMFPMSKMRIGIPINPCLINST